MYSAAWSLTHFANTIRSNLPNSSALPAMSRASISEVFDCMSVLATRTQSSMLRTACPTFNPTSHNV